MLLCIIRLALLKTRSLTATTDLIKFIIVTCKIWRKIGLEHETSMVETETLTIFVVLGLVSSVLR